MHIIHAGVGLKSRTKFTQGYPVMLQVHAIMMCPKL